MTTITWRAADGVGWVTLNRPDRYNAFDQVMGDELQALWLRLRTDDSVRCIVLGAEGGRAFCTGIDRDDVPSEGGAAYTFSPYTYDDPGRQLGPKSNELWKPVIAAVDGIACGGAFYLLGEVDVIIATEASTFFDPHVTYGMPAVYEPLLMLHRNLPFGEVLRMTLLGNHERMTARRAHQIGLVSEVVPSTEALAEAAGWAAAAIASAPPRAIQASLRSLWAGRELTRQQALSLGGPLLNLGMSEEALAEGQKAFEGERITPRLR